MGGRGAIGAATKIFKNYAIFSLKFFTFFWQFKRKFDKLLPKEAKFWKFFFNFG
jgi:hypothetical protein